MTTMLYVLMYLSSGEQNDGPGVRYTEFLMLAMFNAEAVCCDSLLPPHRQHICTTSAALASVFA